MKGGVALPVMVTFPIETLAVGCMDRATLGFRVWGVPYAEW